MLKNNTGEVKNYSKLDTKEFQRLNLEWWNVYESVNTFFLEWRKEKDLWKFKAIWIDLDTGVENKLHSYKELLTYIEERVWILPTRINETYKGYHIFFDLDKELNYLTLDSYKELYDYINKTLWWDYKMVWVTWVLKMEWYFDNKEWRNFEIVTIYKNKENLIWIDYLNRIWIKEEFRKEKTVINKWLQKIRNKYDVENIDWLELINRINEFCDSNHYLIKKKINLIKNTEELYSVEGTDWLKLQLNKEGTKWEICDYSLRTRGGINAFLSNYYFKGESDWTKIKARTILLWKWGIKSSVWGDKFSFPFNLSLWLDKDEIIRNEEDVSYITWKEDITEIESLIANDTKNSILSNSALLKVIAWVVLCWKRNSKDKNQYLVWENDILEAFWKTNSSENKRNLRKMVIELSKLNYSTKEVMDFDGTSLEWIQLKRIFDIWFWKNKEIKDKIFYTIKLRVPYENIIYLPKQSLMLDSDIKEGKRFGLLNHIKLAQSKFSVCNISLEEIKAYLHLHSSDLKKIKDKIHSILKLFKDKEFIHWFEKNEKDIYKIW